LYEREALREEKALRLFERRVHGEYLNRKGMKRQEGKENCTRSAS
jgi:hypothetical protein